MDFGQEYLEHDIVYRIIRHMVSVPLFVEKYIKLSCTISQITIKWVPMLLLSRLTDIMLLGSKEILFLARVIPALALFFRGPCCVPLAWGKESVGYAHLEPEPFHSRPCFEYLGSQNFVPKWPRGCMNLFLRSIFLRVDWTTGVYTLRPKWWFKSCHLWGVVYGMELGLVNGGDWVLCARLLAVWDREEGYGQWASGQFSLHHQVSTWTLRNPKILSMNLVF